MYYDITITGNKSFMSNSGYTLNYKQSNITRVKRYPNCGTQIGFRDKCIYCANISFKPSGLTIVPFIRMNDVEKVEDLVSEINLFISDTSIKTFNKVITLDEINGIQTIRIQREDDE